ncbi:hypothetical protein [Brasilonema sp. UFV-L1]|uniref:hypothetical protein n=1 Tax=Brasilonema sp. UFV-L1 TaxID=2234130 RepID=UPI0030D96BF0
MHICPHCGYTTDRDVAAGQNIRNRGIKLVSTVGRGLTRKNLGSLIRTRTRLGTQINITKAAQIFRGQMRGQTGMETACAVDLPGTDASQSRPVAKSRNRVTRKSKV